MKCHPHELLANTHCYITQWGTHFLHTLALARAGTTCIQGYLNTLHSRRVLPSSSLTCPCIVCWTKPIVAGCPALTIALLSPGCGLCMCTYLLLACRCAQYNNVGLTSIDVLNSRGSPTKTQVKRDVINNYWLLISWVRSHGLENCKRCWGSWRGRGGRGLGDSLIVFSDIWYMICICI